MKNKNIYLIIAGAINLFTGFLHAVGGQSTLINPLLGTNLEGLVKTELLGAWHMVTVTLFATSFILLYFGFKRLEKPNIELLKFTSYLYILFSVAFILVSLFQAVFAPQWVLLLPIGILGLIGNKKSIS